jgi:hypothetical protein
VEPLATNPWKVGSILIMLEVIVLVALGTSTVAIGTHPASTTGTLGVPEALPGFS